jgi:hypothetical protein
MIIKEICGGGVNGTKIKPIINNRAKDSVESVWRVKTKLGSRN